MKEFSLDSKCLITTIDKKSILVITYYCNDKLFCRLPLITEVDPCVIKNNQLDQKDSYAILILSSEISPWHILKPFPPSHFYEDYGYISLINKKETNQITIINKKSLNYSLWDLLPSCEKALVDEI